MTTVASTFLADLAGYADMARREARRHLPTDADEHLVGPAGAYLQREGKGLRPALLLATCEAFGGTGESALPSAAALEMLHTAFLIHDDVEDEAELRRGEAALHRRFGVPLAVNAGDGLAVFALGALSENRRLLGSRMAARIWSEFEFMARQTVEGQAIELGWRRDHRLDLTPDDYLGLIMKKTCWYTTVLPLRLGALIGSRASARLRSMVRFGFHLGAAFQIRDDLLDLTGKPDRYGKEPLGDLREGKRTLMLIHLLAAASPGDRARVEQLLTGDHRGATDATTLLELMEAYGSIRFAREFAYGIARSAGDAFEEAFAGVPDSPARNFVGDMIPYMVERDR